MNSKGGGVLLRPRTRQFRGLPGLLLDVALQASLGLIPGQRELVADALLVLLLLPEALLLHLALALLLLGLQPRLFLLRPALLLFLPEPFLLRLLQAPLLFLRLALLLCLPLLLFLLLLLDGRRAPLGDGRTLRPPRRWQDSAPPSAMAGRCDATAREGLWDAAARGGLFFTFVTRTRGKRYSP